MSKFRSLISITLSVVVFVTLFTVNVSAANFGGSAGYTYKWMSIEVYKPSPAQSSLNWTYSDQASHKMWFVIRNSVTSTDAVSPKLFDYKTSGNFNSSANAGQTLRLRARREHINNPYTYVSGTWNP